MRAAKRAVDRRPVAGRLEEQLRENCLSVTRQTALHAGGYHFVVGDIPRKPFSAEHLTTITNARQMREDARRILKSAREAVDRAQETLRRLQGRLEHEPPR